MPNQSYTVAVVYGGRSPEHEIAIITALQAMHALIEAGHTVVPVYITKQGQWLRGNQQFLQPEFYKNLNRALAEGNTLSLTPGTTEMIGSRSMLGTKTDSVDIVFPVFHGVNGEDGSVHGLIKLLGLPIAGSALTQSAVGMDKYLTKAVARNVGVKVLPDVLITKEWWGRDQTECIEHSFKLAAHLIVKPNSLGSSIGIGIAKDRDSFINAVDVALSYDTRVLVEPLVTNLKEINIAIMGNDPYEFSVTEQPHKEDELLSYQDKYMRGAKKTGAKGMASLQRVIPAPVSPEIEATVKHYAEIFFRAVNGRGMARIDFILDGDEVYFNEINTIPGSLAFYLWDKVGISFPQLADRLVTLGIEAHRTESSLIHTFESNVLANLSLPGAKR